MAFLAFRNACHRWDSSFERTVDLFLLQRDGRSSLAEDGNAETQNLAVKQYATIGITGQPEETRNPTGVTLN